MRPLNWGTARIAWVLVGVAQLVEHLVVVQVVAGSSPVTHPKAEDPAGLSGLLLWDLVVLRGLGGGRRRWLTVPVTHPKAEDPAGLPGLLLWDLVVLRGLGGGRTVEGSDRL